MNHREHKIGTVYTSYGDHISLDFWRNDFAPKRNRDFKNCDQKIATWLFGRDRRVQFSVDEHPQRPPQATSRHSRRTLLEWGTYKRSGIWLKILSTVFLTANETRFIAIKRTTRSCGHGCHRARRGRSGGERWTRSPRRTLVGHTAHHKEDYVEGTATKRLNWGRSTRPLEPKFIELSELFVYGRYVHVMND